MRLQTGKMQPAPRAANHLQDFASGLRAAAPGTILRLAGGLDSKPRPGVCAIPKVPIPATSNVMRSTLLTCGSARRSAALHKYGKRDADSCVSVRRHPPLLSGLGVKPIATRTR